MNPLPRQQIYPLGLVLFALILTFYKAIVLKAGMMVGWSVFPMLVGLDAFYLALLFLGAILTGFARVKWLRVSLWLILVLFTAFFLLDSFVLLALDEHAHLFDIGRYSVEMGVVLSFFDVFAWLAILLLLVAVFVSCEFSPLLKKTSICMLLPVLVFSALSTFYAPKPLLRYSMRSPASLLEGFKPQQQVSSYTEEQIKFFAGLKPEATVIPALKPDIVLLIIESLSSINSARVSGTAGWLDGFDELAREGLLFSNFFANHQASEGGMIALLGGYPPIHFPTATPYMFDEFAIQPSVVAQYQQQGYFTEFLTNSDLRFIGLNHFLDGLGLDRSRGRDEVDAMKTAPRVVQNAPSDRFLYAEALLTIEQLSSSDQPFLLTLATTSTHLPYVHPQQGPDTAEAVWDWSLLQLTAFYQQLRDTGYFEHGVLLITGDHRQMRPLTETETDRYGASARARVPLLVIGKPYPQGLIDERFFQQSDLLRMLGKINQHDSLLSPQTIWVERYNRKYGRIELIDKLSVFDEADLGRIEYRLKISGNRIEWLGERPGFARRVETGIHVQRSAHQKARQAAQQPGIEPGN